MPRYVVVFSLGFFAAVAQALLFREFIFSFEGSELGIGSFFGSWLLWVAAGAVLGRVASPSLKDHLPFLALLYIPAFLLQDLLIEEIRSIVGVASYAAFPLGSMVLASFLVNAPVSAVTGFLFPIACAKGPVSRVYILEALGACAGGVVVTGLIWTGISAETVFIVAASLVLAAWRWPLALVLLLAVAGLGERWADREAREGWTRLLEPESYRGTFSTPQSRYLWGVRDDQIDVISWGGVTETIPGRERASEIAAIHLAQVPDAHRVMVLGEGSLGICLRLAGLPGMERVAWLHPDPDYPPALLEILPEDLRSIASTLEIPRKIPDGTFDLAILNLPDVTTLVLNRYVTREHLTRIRENLSPEGVVSVRISGGENYLGGELALLGASMLATMESVFPRVVIRPGEETWMMASSGEGITTAPGILRDRLASREGVADLYPPDEMLTLYRPDRVHRQMEAYREAMAGTDESVLVNTRARPKALLYGLAVGLRRAGIHGVGGILPVLTGSLFWICLAGLGIYLALRLLYLRSGRGDHLDPHYLVLSTGAAGMALGVLLMFLFQARFGSLYLHVGLVSALFMAGLTAGGLIVETVLERRGREPPLLIWIVVGAFILILLAAHLPQEGVPLLFVPAGMVTGACFPIAAGRMKEAGRAAAQAGARLEVLDHLGGAAGAVLCGLLLLPVCGIHLALVILGILVAINLVPLRDARPVPGDAFDRSIRLVAYWGMGLAAFLLMASQIVHQLESSRRGRALEEAARAMAGEGKIEEDGSHFIVLEPEGYIFDTAGMARDIHGYGGPIDLAVFVDKEGSLRDFRVLRSRETPAYLEMTRSWREDLPGRDLFGPDPFEGVDAVTGATLTSDAILRTLERGGRTFAWDVLGLEVKGTGVEGENPYLPDHNFIVLATLATLAILSRYFPRPWPRRALLLGVILLSGLWLNLQYSTQQVFALLSLRIPAPVPSAAFFTVIGVPVMVILFGNIYCGHLCPFGALQELLGDLRGKRIRTDPAPHIWRWGRSVKYILLVLLGVAFALGRDPSVLSGDPLITFFSGIREGWVFALGAAALGLSLIFRRFWCRSLCPAGAFLSLLGSLKILRRIIPGVHPGRCDMGVRTGRDLDCLGCDRCRHAME